MSRPDANGATVAELELGGRHSRIVQTTIDRLQDDDPQLVIADVNTASLVPAHLRHLLFQVPAGEACKSWDVLGQTLQAISGAGISRDQGIAAVGGGAVTDLAACAASLYLRGVAVTLVPTSLLAMVDAAIGGKTAIDFAGKKNVVGTFFAADRVILDTDMLATLSDREYRSGLAEVIKAGLLGDPALVQLLEERRDAVEQRDPAVVRELVVRAVNVKVAVVAADFKESGRRAELNLGHTFAHALEAVAGLGAWTHGEAVAWGIARAMYAGLNAGLTDRDWALRVIRLLSDYDFDVNPSEHPADALIAAMAFDKKRRTDGLRFVLQRTAGETHVVPMDHGQLADILNDTSLVGGHS